MTMAPTDRDGPVTLSAGPSSLGVSGVSVAYSGLVALDDVTLTVERGEILGLIGPNGAGKTTLLNVLSGYERPPSGDVRLGDRTVTGLSPAARASLGVARTFQGGRLFARLTVRENLEVAAIGGGARGRRARARVNGILERLDLADCAEMAAGALSYGDERRVALARAIALGPSFLLLDEPAAGLDEDETAELAAAIRAVRDEHGCGVLVVEHDMSLIMGLCDRIHVLTKGRTLMVGPPDAVRGDRDVQEAYLGTGHGDG